MTSDAVTPERAFALLGSDLRLALLRALFDADGGPLAFSDLKARVDAADSGRVNYHLGRLEPHFVERTPDGYRLRRPGYRAVRVLRAGALTGDADLDPTPLDGVAVGGSSGAARPSDGDCVRCGGRLELRYSDGFAAVVCPDCANWFVRYAFPPGGLDGRTPGEVAAALDAECRSVRRRASAGVCPMCGGRADSRLVAAPPRRFDHPAHVTYECEQCRCRLDSTVGAAVAEHPAVVAFHHDHGRDALAPPLWALPFAFDPNALAVVAESPPRARLSVELDGDELRLVVDETGAVVGTERR